MSGEEGKEQREGDDQGDEDRERDGQPESVTIDSESGQDQEEAMLKEESDQNGFVDEEAQGELNGDTDAKGKPVLSPLQVPSPTILSGHPADDMHAPDSPTTSLISALRLSLQQLTEQSHQLNTKLVTSFSRVADLEGTIDELNEEKNQQAKTMQELEKEKSEWEESMKTGLLVERDQIRDEMQRLAAGLVEEERRRGSAELGREKLEGEVDTLTASLFDQANTMVATERHGRVQAETRLKLAEDNLSVAEAAVRDMQVHLQTLSAAATPAPSSVQPIARQHQLLTSHIPYTEFLTFIQHIRMSRPQKQSSISFFPPTPVPSLLSQPFLARAITEDHEPCLRLDAAPDLSWLSRRSVGAAIIAGELMIEPVSASSVLSATSTPAHELTCSLCAKYVFPQAAGSVTSPMASTAPPSHPLSKTGNSSSRFSLKPFFNTSTSAPASPSPTPSSPKIQASLGTVYIFRIAPPATAAPATTTDAKSYPLCRSGWCLERLRATCAFWHFVRSGMVQVIWKGEDGVSSTPVITDAARSPRPDVADAAAAPPSLPPRKKSWGLGGFKSGSGTAATSSNGSSGWGLGFKGAGLSPPVSPRAAKSSTEQALLSEKTSTADESMQASMTEATGDEVPAAEAQEGEVSAMIESSEDIDTDGQKGLPTEATDVGVAAETTQPAEESAVPIVVEAPVENLDGEVDQTPTTPSREDRLDASAPASSASSTHGSDGDEASFSTPKGTNAELSPAPSSPALPVEGATETQTEGPASEEPSPARAEAAEASVAGEATSPPAEAAEASGDAAPEVARPTRRAVPPPPSADGAAPPPVPRRAAGRARPASRIIDGETVSGAATPVEDGSRTPAVHEESRSVTPEPSVPAHAPAEAEQKVAPATLASPPSLPSRAGVPPPLPTRTPRSSVDISTPPLPPREKQRPASLAPSSGKTYAEGEEWEVKTWKEIVKLKEAMWKARVGVEDVDE